MSTLNHVTDQNFEQEVLNSDTPVLVDFYADWCGPCKMIAPTLQELADEVGNDFHVSKLDIDANGETAQAYNVSSIPTLILFKNGQPVERFVGVVSKEHILERTSQHLTTTETTPAG